MSFKEIEGINEFIDDGIGHSENTGREDGSERLEPQVSRMGETVEDGSLIATSLGHWPMTGKKGLKSL